MKDSCSPKGVETRQANQCDVCDVCEDKLSITKQNRFPIKPYNATQILPLQKTRDDTHMVIVDRTVLSNGEQTSFFLERFEELAENNKERIVNHKELKLALVSSGKFFVGEAQFAIEQMLKSGKIVETGFQQYKRGEESIAISK
jgi:hypothetical protein